MSNGNPGRTFGRLIGWALLLTSAGMANAQDEGIAVFGTKAPAKPKFTTTLTPADAKPGDEVTLSISVALPKGYYIYSTAGDFNGRTIIETNPVGLDEIDAEFAPNHPPKEGFEELLKATVGKHFDAVTWSRKYRVQADAKTASVAGKLSGQYCSGPDAKEQACLQIRPPYQFEAQVQLNGGDVASADTPFQKHFQPTTKRAGETVPGPIALDISLLPANAQPGEKVTLSIKATLEERWHTFALTHNGEGGVATFIKTPTIVGLRPLGEEFQPDHEPEVEQHKTQNITQLVHNHMVTWSREFEVEGPYYISGEIGFQTCRNGQCLPLKRIQFNFGEAPEVAVAPAGPDAEIKRVADPEPLAGGFQPPKSFVGFLSFLAACGLGGLTALLLPCSFPMIPITVSFFLKQSEAEHKRPWLLALVYCGTIVAAFTILGVGIAALFGAAQLNLLANLPWLNMTIGIAFVVFALSMLGMFEIQMPSWLLTFTASKESAGSYLGAVFMALTFTLTSFTCTVAVVGPLLLSASKGDLYWPVIGMLTFGLAFAAPFFVLAMVPGLLKKLPKSGGWMNTVKVVMGLVELGAAVKFFSIADSRQIVLDQVTVLTIWFILAMITAIYLFGWFRMPHDSVISAISPLRLLSGTSFFIAAGFLATAIAMPQRGGLAVRQILAFAPMKIETKEGPLGLTAVHEGLEFALDLDKAIPFASKENRPLLLDFTGVNCTNCRDMEQKFVLPAWRERIVKFVGVQLYVDVPYPGIADVAEGKRLFDKSVKAWDEIAQDNTMPGYAIMTPDGKKILAKHIGAEIVPGTFVQFLDEGWKQWEKQKENGGPAIGMTDREDGFRQ